MNAMQILRDDWEALDEAGDHVSLDMPAHLLAYVRARAYGGAEEAWEEKSEAMSLLQMGLSAENAAYYRRQYVRASRMQVAYLRVLMSTIEMFVPDPQETR